MTTLTTLAAPARSDEDANLRPMPWRRMAWVTWRQHRAALTGVAVLLGAMAVAHVDRSAFSFTTPTPPRSPATRRARLPAATWSAASMACTAFWRTASYCRRCPR